MRVATCSSIRLDLGAAVVLLCATAVGAGAQAPADIPPVGMNMMEVSYPHPVSTMPLTLYGQDVQLAYMDVRPAAGNGATVVLLHGFNFFGEYWGGTIDALTGAGYRVIVPDQIGFGRSTKALLPYTLNDMALNTRRLLQHLGVEQAAIVGHSMGGMLAARFAMLYPAITTHTVLVNPIGLTDPRPGRAPRYLDDAYRADSARTTPQRTFESVRQGIVRYFVTWRPEYEKYVRIHWGWTISPDWPHFSRVRSAVQQIISSETVVYDWQHIRSRALVIGGEVDGPNFPALARAAATAIPGAELHLIPNVGHVPQLESPEVFHTRLIAFLRAGG